MIERPRPLPTRGARAEGPEWTRVQQQLKVSVGVLHLVLIVLLLGVPGVYAGSGLIRPELDEVFRAPAKSVQSREERRRRREPQTALLSGRASASSAAAAAAPGPRGPRAGGGPCARAAL